MKDNIIRVTLGSPDVTVWADYRYQYDYGQILKFDGADLPFAYQVDFSNTPVRGEAKSSIGDADGVEIPDEYFLSGENIYAWVFLHTGLDDGETVWAVVIPIKKKSKPKNAAPTPVQQSVIDQTIAALDAGVEAAQDAQRAAEAAQGKAEDAQEAAETAQGKAETAQEKAETAQGKAEDAQEKAETAQEKAEDAKEGAETAEHNAEDYSKASKSWAVGGTGTRQGEDTDNAKYYSIVAGQQAATAGYLDIHIDSSGHLIYTRTDQVDVDFELINGHLIMEAV